MEEIKFNNIEDLYKRVKPALDCKVHELFKRGITYINSNDIWNALKSKKWNKASDLVLSDIIDDILNTDDEFFISFMQNYFKNVKRDINLNDEIL